MQGSEGRRHTRSTAQEFVQGRVPLEVAAFSMVPNRWMRSLAGRTCAWKLMTRDRHRIELNVSPTNLATKSVSKRFHPTNSIWQVWIEYGNLRERPTPCTPPPHHHHHPHTHMRSRRWRVQLLEDTQDDRSLTNGSMDEVGHSAQLDALPSATHLTESVRPVAWTPQDRLRCAY